MRIHTALNCVRLSCAIYPPEVAAGDDECTPTEAGAFFEIVEDIGLKPLDFAAMKSTGTEFGVARDARCGQLFIVIRGTAGLRDIITDATAWREKVQTRARPWRIHAGGLAAARSCYQLIAAHISAHPFDRVIFTGHSLGGMIARILRAMIPTAKSTALNWRPIHCYTFGSPRPGCRQLASDLAKQAGDDYRIEHRADPVVWIPGALSALTPWPRYRHAGTPYRPTTNKRGLAAHACAHYLDTLYYAKSQLDGS